MRPEAGIYLYDGRPESKGCFHTKKTYTEIVLFHNLSATFLHSFYNYLALIISANELFTLLIIEVCCHAFYQTFDLSSLSPSKQTLPKNYFNLRKR